MLKAADHLLFKFILKIKICKEEEIQQEESVRNLKRVEQALKLSSQIANCTQPTNANTSPSKSRNTNTEERQLHMSER